MLGASTAVALAVTFEDVAVASGSNIVVSGNVTSGGFLFSVVSPPSNHLHKVNDSPSFSAFNGTTYLGIHDDDFNNDTTHEVNILTMSPVGGGTCSLLSLDVAEWLVNATEHASTVVVTGVGGTNPSLTITLDNIADGSGALVDFQTVLFGPSWTGLTAVTFDGEGPGASGTNQSGFALDNINANVAVPEPTTPLLFGIGLAAVLARSRRRRIAASRQ